ncbi:MAG: indole-3-glycerol phosphate synthase TrpC [Lachnospiraceae bacterium]|nr:indole-3-glycerol phosphate synthase TrpC [Lachnospiraceae bacterium]
MNKTKTILDALAAHAKERTDAAKLKISAQDMKKRALELQKGDRAFENALKKDGMSFILECKKASPSKGLIAPDFPYLDIAKTYEAIGADCISVLTEPKWFLGSGAYLKEIAQAVSIPCLRKDFTVDEYMIYEAAVLGAKAVLLIVSILSEGGIKEYLGICDELGISAVVETHDEDEVFTALDAGARIIGVNNRDLKDFSVDQSNAARLRKIIPDDRIFISESGIKTAADVKAAHDAGADALLIGETVMRAEDKKAAFDELRSLL